MTKNRFIQWRLQKRMGSIHVLRKRLRMVSALMGALFIVMLGRVMMLAFAMPTTQSTDVSPAMRGAIMDRHGIILAHQEMVASIFAHPRDIKNAEMVAAQLKQYLPHHVTQDMTQDKNFVWLARNIPDALADEIINLGLAGIHKKVTWRRHYPHNSLFAHVVGMSDVDSRGLGGIELSMNDRLKEREQQLTLDMRVQTILHDELAKAVLQWDGLGGVAIMLAGASGELLGMLSLPDFDPHHPHNMSFPSASAGLYDFGSLFELFDFAAHLEGDVSPKELMARMSMLTPLAIALPERAAPRTWGDNNLRTTPLHMAYAFAAMVNGGWYHAPRLLLDDTQPRPSYRVMSRENSIKMRQHLKQGRQFVGAAARLSHASIRGREEGRNLIIFLGALSDFIVMFIIDTPYAQSPEDIMMPIIHTIASRLGAHDIVHHVAY